ncbi:hypothetical protein CAC42_6122 [Sphaceloma murrayae]|uniref:Uncharacterized protein n=1 Tax=Sphaceloma murrayae TaxID=2082308 RepID=A0A2K1QVD7_9PEZI|nr:hypothetical protein CAC42_6122 [Sphaceloma murrayae]
MNRKRSRDDSTHSERRPKSPRRNATLYDAVAGRIGYESFLPTTPPSPGRNQPSSTQPVPPEEVLFRRKGAPPRYEETDPYFASARLPPDALPSSDLLKALHGYASDFYARAAPLRGKWDWRSMDETALLALGVLMEETVRERVGLTGDLAFVEGEDEDVGIKAGIWDGRTWRRSVVRKEGTGPRGRRRARGEDGGEG